MQERLSLSSNLLVVDEAMQHMDPAGQHATIEMLKGLPKETLIVIEHGVVNDSLRGQFNHIDVVEKVHAGHGLSRVVLQPALGGEAGSSATLASAQVQ
jgi:ABC-type Mn2+/Zn2+ transport system ATPase subunit|eukprot:5808744-Prymnesium_polylepis.1